MTRQDVDGHTGSARVDKGCRRVAAVEQEACQPHVAVLRRDVQGKIAVLSIDGLQ